MDGKKLIFAAALSVSIAFSVEGQTADYKERTTALYKKIYQHFYDSTTGLFRETTDRSGKDKPNSYLWPLCALVQATNEMEALQPGMSYMPKVEHAIDEYYDTRRGVAGYAAYVVKQSKEDRFYDDNQWIGLAYMDAYNRTKKKIYLLRSQVIYRFMMTGYDSIRGGGLYWKEGDLSTKNTCSNGPGVLLALQLYKATRDKHYLDTALLLYRWTNHALQSPDGLYYDNIRTADGTIARNFYTYNTGTMLQANVMLFAITGQQMYLSEAQRLAAASLAFFFKKDRFPGNYWFNAVLLRGYQDLYKVDKNKVYISAFFTEAEGIWHSEMDGDGLAGPDAVKKLLDQGGLLEIVARLAMIQNEEAKPAVAKPSGAKPTGPVRERTAFQISAPWRAEYDVRSDVAIVYGMSDDFEERVKAYRENGYTVHFMTGIAWGEYQDYFTGKFDGHPHWDEGQKQRNGDTIWHGHFVPYIVPTAGYLNYMKSIVKRVIDAGITAIYLEEPEFWARAGYSESFKTEWQKYYNFPWMAQHESPEATYLSSKLKYHLYYNALNEVFTYAKAYGHDKGIAIRCYVPTHSLLNYSAWQIVSPEASLAALPSLDGYIAQVWTGTSREAVFFDGVKKERVFENAFLEYGSMLSMTAPTHRKMYFLTDPIEDARRSWDYYKQNYQATFSAQLMYPSVNNYEVMPWPNRIYMGKFKVENMAAPQPISPKYATQMQVMVNSLNDIPLSLHTVKGSKGIGVLLSNSMMFQRFPTHKDYSDPQLSNFYGMALPLLKRGVPVETVHMENLAFPETLQGIKVLIMSYANMKPPTPAVHRYLTDWVRKGGILIYYGRDDDPFQTVKEWWNSDGSPQESTAVEKAASGYRFSTPSEHLFGSLGLEDGASSKSVGKGRVYVVRQDPKELVLTKGQDSGFIQLVQNAYKTATQTPLQFKNYLYLERGCYTIAAVMDETVNNEPLTIKGPVIDLFDPTLPVLAEKVVQPGQQAYVYDPAKMADKTQPKVLCAAARVSEEKRATGTYSFLARSPSGTENVMRIFLPSGPKAIWVGGAPLNLSDPATNGWDAPSRTCLLKFVNDHQGVAVKINY